MGHNKAGGNRKKRLRRRALLDWRLAEIMIRNKKYKWRCCKCDELGVVILPMRYCQKHLVQHLALRMLRRPHKNKTRKQFIQEMLNSEGIKHFGQVIRTALMLRLKQGNLTQELVEIKQELEKGTRNDLDSRCDHRSADH